MKLLSIVFLYYPNSEVENNILSYSKDCNLVVLWDNTPNGSKSIPHVPNAIIVDNNHKNMGLAYAYNQAIKIAKEHNCTHIMTMDQDSRFENFSGYRDWVNRTQHPGISSVAINQKEKSSEESTIINDSAQSGSIFPIKMIDEIGPFREDFFIGMVDAEMCLRAQEHNYLTLQYNKANLVHQIGSERKVKILQKNLDYTKLNFFEPDLILGDIQYKFIENFNVETSDKKINSVLKEIRDLLTPTDTFFYEQEFNNDSLVSMIDTSNNLLASYGENDVEGMKREVANLIYYVDLAGKKPDQDLD